MKSNCRTLPNQMRGTVALLSAALLCAAPSMAQMTPEQQQPPPVQQTTPGSQTAPGSRPNDTSPMDQEANRAQEQKEDARMADRMFVRKALEGGMAEVQFGQLALQKSSNADVKEFAQKMVDDHTKLGDQMKPVAEQMKVKEPTALSGKDKATFAKLKALNGDAFDKAYIKDMVKDHQQDEKEFKREAQSASDPALKEIAAQGEQIISEHLQMIEQIAQKNSVASMK